VRFTPTARCVGSFRQWVPADSRRTERAGLLQYRVTDSSPTGTDHNMDSQAFAPRALCIDTAPHPLSRSDARHAPCFGQIR